METENKFPYWKKEADEKGSEIGEEKGEIAKKRQRYLEEILAQNPQMPMGAAVELVSARIRAEEEAKKEHKE